MALLRAFDPNNANPTSAILAAASQIEVALSARSFADVNEGQFAALIDFVIWKGLAFFLSDPIFTWVSGGNLTLPPDEFATYGKRGIGEQQMWNLGNSE